MDSNIQDRFEVVYRLQATGEEARTVAESLRVEQTIEFPLELVPRAWFKDEVTGQIVSFVEEENTSVVTISYGAPLTAFEATQFLNVVFGNSSLQPGIWVEDIHLSESLLSTFAGPRFGMEGVRRLVNKKMGPMLQAVIKPMGLSASELANMCKAYTLGGAHVIKDDHGITNQSFAPFKERVARCAEAVKEGNAQSGHSTLYAANISGDGTDVLERAYLAKKLGATALMVAPALIGYGWLHKLSTDDNLNLPIISHPAMMGGFVLPGISGITSPVWMGLLPRLMGADMTIFVSYGGRFTFTAQECLAIMQQLTKPLASIKASCPGPGGGVTAARLPELKGIYGSDVMYLVGGDMFRRSTDLEANMKFFIDLLDS